MLPAIKFLNILLPLLYCALFTFHLVDFLKDEKIFGNSKRIVLLVLLILHTIFLVFRTIEYDHTPITSKFEIFSIIAFSIAFSYFVLELLTDIRGTGTFIIFFSTLFQVISSLFIHHTYLVPDVLRNRLLGMHVISALLGYSGITIAAVYGILFLLLYKNLKTNKFGIFFDRLPSLEILEKLNFNSTLIGFALLSVAIIIGIIWLPQAFPKFSYFDPKLIGTLIVWLTYGVGIVLRFINHWYGKKVINFSLIGFAVAILSLILTNTLASTFHSFY